MTDVALRDLRNNTSELLRRVENGEQLTVTVNGRGVAKLVPLPRRPRSMSWQQLLRHPADADLATELRDLLPDTTDELEDPWSRESR